jgi:hypothetical protein
MPWAPILSLHLPTPLLTHLSLLHAAQVHAGRDALLQFQDKRKTKGEAFGRRGGKEGGKK